MQSFWQQASPGTFIPLHGDLIADIVIVGAGYTGSWLAYWLRNQGLRVVVLDSRQPGYGASGRNGGLLLQGSAQLVSEAAHHMGQEAALAIVDGTRESFQWVSHLAQHYDMDYHMTGSLYVGGDRDERSTLAETAELLQSRGIAARLQDRLHQPLSIQRLHYDDALWIPDDGRVHPLKLIQALLAESQAAGVKVFSDSPVRHYEEGSGEGRLIGDQFRVTAPYVVAATNADTHDWLPNNPIPLMPTRGQMLASAPAAPLDHAYPVYADHGYNYWHQRPDGRIILGGFRHLDPDHERGTDLVLHDQIQERLGELLHDLTGAPTPVDYRWSGIMAMTPDHSPYVGALSPHLWVAVGYSGHGSTVTPFVARMVKDAILDHRPIVAPFSVGRLKVL